MGTFHAEPGAVRDIFQSDAMGVIWCVTPVAEKQDFFIFCSVAHRAGRDLFLLFLWVLVEPSEGVELGNLFLIFDFVGA